MSETVPDCAVCWVAFGAQADLGLVEPLWLPMPGRVRAPPTGQGRDDTQLLDDAIALVRQVARGQGPAATHPPRGTHDRVRYRWLVGHQVSFVVWQLATESLVHLTSAATASSKTVLEVADYLDLYSAMLLYTASCSPEQYHQILRPAMRAADPAFSGTWARDHEALPKLLKTLRHRHPGAAVRPVTDAYRDSRLMHIAVARYLVRDGVSLLRQARQGSGGGPTESERDLFDRFFQVIRTDVGAHWRAAQLLRRLGQVLCDIELHPLEPFDPDVFQFRTDGCLVERLRSDMKQVVVRVADRVHMRVTSPPPSLRA